MSISDYKSASSNNDSWTVPAGSTLSVGYTMYSGHVCSVCGGGGGASSSTIIGTVLTSGGCCGGGGSTGNSDGYVWVETFPIVAGAVPCKINRKFSILEEMQNEEDAKVFKSLSKDAVETPEQKESRLWKEWIKGRKESLAKAINPPDKRRFLSEEEIRKIEMQLMANVEKDRRAGPAQILKHLCSKNVKCPECAVKLIPFGYDYSSKEIVLGCAACFRSYGETPNGPKLLYIGIDRSLKYLEVFVDGPFWDAILNKKMKKT